MNFEQGKKRAEDITGLKWEEITRNFPQPLKNIPNSCVARHLVTFVSPSGRDTFILKESKDIDGNDSIFLDAFPNEDDFGFPIMRPSNRIMN